MPDTSPLLQFIEFLDDEFELDSDDRKSAKKISGILTDLDKNKDRDCSMSLDIYDVDIQSQQSDRQGIYWREWSIFLEGGSLEVRARSHSEPETLKNKQYNLEWFCDLKTGAVETNGTLEAWLADAQDYKKYITENLNEVEVEFDV